MPKDDEKKTSQRKRQDRRDDQEKPEKRLDALALLLERTFMCSAVSIIDEKIYIGLNSIHAGSTDGMKKKAEEFIDTVFGYFSDIAKNKKLPDDKKRLETFSYIFSNRSGVEKSLGLRLAEAIFEDKRISNIKLLKEFKDVPVETIGKAHIWGDIVCRDFKKLEKFFLKDENQKTSFFQLMKKGSYELLKEGKENVHAEMRILGHLLKKIINRDKSNKTQSDNEIYIGISKLCCLKCECMLNAAKETLEKSTYKITLDFGGEHDLEKNWKWVPPSPFKGKIFSTRMTNQPDGIVRDIALLAKNKMYKQKSQEEESKGVRQFRNLSSSEPSTSRDSSVFGEEINIQEKILLLRDIINFNKSNKIESIEILNIGLKFFKKKDLYEKLLSEVGESDLEEKSKNFETTCEELKLNSQKEEQI